MYVYICLYYMLHMLSHIVDVEKLELRLIFATLYRLNMVRYGKCLPSYKIEKYMYHHYCAAAAAVVNVVFVAAANHCRRLRRRKRRRRRCRRHLSSFLSLYIFNI